MGGSRARIEAETMEELERKVREWERSIRRGDMMEIRRGWDPDQVVKTDSGYMIEVSAHT